MQLLADGRVGRRPVRVSSPPVRLVRKGYALVRAYRSVTCKADWMKPREGAATKAWKSKVDWEAARRLDPQLVDQGPVTVQAAEEEVKKVLEREAAILKAKNKFASQAGGDSGP